MPRPDLYKHLPDPTCATCGKTFVVPGKRRLSARYCSKACADRAKETAETRTCPTCGKAVRLEPSRLVKGAKFCSLACSAASRVGVKRPGMNRSLRVARVCKECGTEFLAQRDRVARGIARYCSNACKFKAAQNRVTRTCAQCGAPFDAHPKRIMDGRGRFCSRRCYYLYSGTAPSGPELLLTAALSEAGLSFTREAVLGKYRVDFLVGGIVAVEVDGAFWHSLPGAAEKDAKKDAAIIRRGWRVLRLDSDRVGADPAFAVAQIREVLNATA